MAACLTVTRTGKFQVRPAANAGKRVALLATVQGWDRAVAFHPDFLLEHPGFFSEQKPHVVRRGRHAGEERRRPLTNQEILTWAERRTVATRAHPNPARDFGKVCPEAPTVPRRVAVNHAAGAVRAHRSNLANREAADPGKRGQAPAPSAPGGLRGTLQPAPGGPPEGLSPPAPLGRRALAVAQPVGAGSPLRPGTVRPVPDAEGAHRRRAGGAAPRRRRVGRPVPGADPQRGRLVGPCALRGPAAGGARP